MESGAWRKLHKTISYKQPGLQALCIYSSTNLANLEEAVLADVDVVSRPSKKRKKSRQREEDMLARGTAAAMEAAKSITTGQEAEKKMLCSKACRGLLENILKVQTLLHRPHLAMKHPACQKKSKNNHLIRAIFIHA